MSVKTVISVVGMVGIGAASFAYMDHLGLRTGVLEDVRTASLSVSDTNGLVVGSRVLLRGIPVGEITAVTPSADKVTVDWKYNSEYDIPADSRFRLDNLSALGETYLAVLPSTTSGPYLGDNALVADSQVTVPTTFKELSQRVTRLLEQVEPERLQAIFRELDIALPDGAEVIGNLETAGELLAKTIIERTGPITTLLSSIQPILMDSDTLPGDFAAATPSLTPFGVGFTGLIDGLHFAVDRGPLEVGIRDGAGPFITELQVFLDKSAADLNVIGVDLIPAVGSAAAALQTVDVGRMLDNALAATDSGDAVDVHVRTPGR